MFKNFQFITVSSYSLCDEQANQRKEEKKVEKYFCIGQKFMMNEQHKTAFSKLRFNSKLPIDKSNINVKIGSSI